MSSKHWPSIVALLIGLTLLGGELVRAPSSMLLAAGVYIVVWLVRKRGVRRRRRPVRLYRLRRDVLSTALIASLALTVMALGVTAMELSNESQPLPGDPVQTTDDDPWAKMVLLNGIATIAGISLLVAGAAAARGRQKGRPRRKRRPISPELATQMPSDTART